EVHSRSRRRRSSRGLASSCPRRSKGVPVSPVTRWALNHKKIVVLVWLCLTAAGAFASLGVGNKLTKGLPIPGQPAYEANLNILPVLKAHAPPGGSVVLTGYEQLSAGSTPKGGGGPSVLVETLIGAVGALLVLAFVFASAVAVLPLLIAVITILTTFLLVSGMTHLTPVSFLIQFLVAIVGLGVPIDFSLLIVTRWREELGHGLSNPEAIVAAAQT